MPPPPKLNEDTDYTHDDFDHYQDTGEMRFSIFAEKLAEYEKLKEWHTRWNAGLPCSPQPPQGKHYKPTLLPPPPTPPPSPKPSKHVYDEDDFDPAADVEPDNPKDDDESTCYDDEPTSSTASTSKTPNIALWRSALIKQSEDDAWSESMLEVAKMTTDDGEEE